MERRVFTHSDFHVVAIPTKLTCCVLVSLVLFRTHTLDVAIQRRTLGADTPSPSMYGREGQPMLALCSEDEEQQDCCTARDMALRPKRLDAS